MPKGVAIVRDVRPPAPAPRLTTRHYRALERLALGESNKRIGSHLGLSTGTVKQYLIQAAKIMGCENRTEMIVRFPSWQAMLLLQRLGVFPVAFPSGPETPVEITPSRMEQLFERVAALEAQMKERAIA